MLGQHPFGFLDLDLDQTGEALVDAEHAVGAGYIGEGRPRAHDPPPEPGAEDVLGVGLARARCAGQRVRYPDVCFVCGARFDRGAPVLALWGALRPAGDGRGFRVSIEVREDWRGDWGPDRASAKRARLRLVDREDEG